VCRHFHVALRPCADLAHAARVVEDCSKKNTKAGYDAAGLAVLLEGSPPELRVSRDGGDLLHRWPDLRDRLGLRPGDRVRHWSSHIRQASQGDLYAAANAHPHRERLPSGRLRVAGVEVEVGAKARFAISHNGDLFDADRYKALLGAEGFGLDARLADLADLADRLAASGAGASAVAAGLVARVLERSCRESKLVLQSLSPLDGGSYDLVRGGTRDGGEPGGEAIVYLPGRWDEANWRQVVALVGSEENSFKDVVALLEAGAAARGECRLSAEQARECGSVDGLRATARGREGVLPVHDVRPGEMLEIGADGGVRLYDLYDGVRIELVPFGDARHPEPSASSVIPRAARNLGRRGRHPMPRSSVAARPAEISLRCLGQGSRARQGLGSASERWRPLGMTPASALRMTSGRAPGGRGWRR
jgi:hypothetical protein